MFHVTSVRYEPTSTLIISYLSTYDLCFTVMYGVRSVLNNTHAVLHITLIHVLYSHVSGYKCNAYITKSSCLWWYGTAMCDVSR